ncbi:MAG: hypothetical protein WD034_06350, partial [Parvibaculum sp.]|uniref:hypothetical protein n=1 Tax=Parvibaculum sp. TaxID=2024848 RepID=UPI0034A0AE22
RYDSGLNQTRLFLAGQQWLYAGHPRLATRKEGKKDVDDPDKPGHDGFGWCRELHSCNRNLLF